MFLSAIFLVLFLGLNMQVKSQINFRRHFIITYDVSTPFIVAEKSTPEFERTLIDLFSGATLINSGESNQTGLLTEKENGLTFFDPNRDEISFFHFNIARSEFSFLQATPFIYNEDEIVESFNDTFLKDKNFYWSDYYSSGTGDIKSYIQRIFQFPRNPPIFGAGISLSNFVYPLVLSQIDSSKFAEEYILIILSDFLTGSMHGNKMDFNRIKELYCFSLNSTLSQNSAPMYIKKFSDKLSSGFYKIDYFEFTFNNTINRNPISILSYKVKPKAGNLNPEDISVFVDSDLKLSQRGYRSGKFKIPESSIKFTHNDHLKPVEVHLKISISQGNKQTDIFSGTIARSGENGAWSSEYTNSNDLMKFNSSKSLYLIPTLKINLDTIINQRNFDFVKFEYSLNSTYKADSIHTLNFIYKTERSIAKENVNFTTKTSRIIMLYLIPTLILFAIILILMIIGKPKKMKFNVDGYLDSYEVVDYKKFGKLHTPYTFWNSSQDDILVNGVVYYRYRDFPFNWKSIIYLTVQDHNVPDGFEVFLKPDFSSIKEFSQGNLMTVQQSKGHKIKFVIGIRQNDLNHVIDSPELVKINILAIIKSSILFLKSEVNEPISYNFHLGTDLKDVWVGFDPGTTGSCVAVGNSTENIMLGEDIAKKKIIPSVLIFEKAADFHPNGSVIQEGIYHYGSVAESRYSGENKYRSFHSIKKLLGYKDLKEVIFDNKNVLQLKGKDLASLLITGLYKDAVNYFSRPDYMSYYFKHDKSFNPLRAVVAIPNNFTIVKVQDMIDCIKGLNQFKEIRYVYEAEAVLFYYLSNFSKLCQGEPEPESETVLVFDMGGATINATVVSAVKTKIQDNLKYNIDLLGKIGYGIGGDTIDYCISRFILSFTDEFPQLRGINILDKKNQLSDLAFQIKKEITLNFYKNNNYLITAFNLENWINKALNISITIDEENSKMYKCFLKSSGEFKIFKHSLFSDTIYNNVKDAVQEVVDLAEVGFIDRVIFSGRSTSFPLIKETVESHLTNIANKPKILILGLEKSKTAVALGACWYGINKNSVSLNNLKTNASFGFKKTLSADMANVKYHELIAMGCPFDIHDEKMSSHKGEISLNDDFSFDGTKVNFYQVMGKNANKILSEDQKHKYSKVASILLDKSTTSIGMRVSKNDDIECAVKLVSNKVIQEKGVVADQEIDEANEEHYTWLVN